MSKFSIFSLGGIVEFCESIQTSQTFTKKNDKKGTLTFILSCCKFCIELGTTAIFFLQYIAKLNCSNFKSITFWPPFF